MKAAHTNVAHMNCTWRNFRPIGCRGFARCAQSWDPAVVRRGGQLVPPIARPLCPWAREHSSCSGNCQTTFHQVVRAEEQDTTGGGVACSGRLHRHHYTLETVHRSCAHAGRCSWEGAELQWQDVAAADVLESGCQDCEDGGGWRYLKLDVFLMECERSWWWSCSMEGLDVGLDVCHKIWKKCLL